MDEDIVVPGCRAVRLPVKEHGSITSRRRGRGRSPLDQAYGPGPSPKCTPLSGDTAVPGALKGASRPSRRVHAGSLILPSAASASAPWPDPERICGGNRRPPEDTAKTGAHSRGRYQGNSLRYHRLAYHPAVRWIPEQRGMGRIAVSSAIAPDGASTWQPIDASPGSGSLARQYRRRRVRRHRGSSTKS